jgi:dihydroflavonol-4-reductase
MSASPRNVLVTGGTGMVGHCIVQSLLARGHRVRALVRSPDKGRALLPAACELVQGDVTAPETLGAAAAGCEWVFHAAGFPEQWMRDPETFDRINAGGTANMVAAARAAGAKRFVLTSTIDVFRWRAGETYDESELDPEPKRTAYERSKQRADRIVAEAAAAGLDAVFLHPSGVYGPAPTDSPGTNDLLRKLCHGQVPALLPGGYPVVFAPDVGEGHVRAAERAPAGARYILSERYYSLTDLVAAMSAALGLSRAAPRVLPLWLASTVSSLGELKGKLTGRPPLIPKGQLQFLQVGAYPTAQRATDELGLAFTPLAEGLARTVEWQRATGKLPPAPAR